MISFDFFFVTCVKLPSSPWSPVVAVESPAHPGPQVRGPLLPLGRGLAAETEIRGCPEGAGFQSPAALCGEIPLWGWSLRPCPDPGIHDGAGPS